MVRPTCALTSRKLIAEMKSGGDECVLWACPADADAVVGRGMDWAAQYVSKADAIRCTNPVRRSLFSTLSLVTIQSYDDHQPGIQGTVARPAMANRRVVSPSRLTLDDLLEAKGRRFGFAVEINDGEICCAREGIVAHPDHNSSTLREPRFYSRDGNRQRIALPLL